jgi:hypothetical protein
LPLLRQHPLTPSDESAGECETQVPRDHSLEKEVGARFQQIQQVLVLEGKVVQVVQQVIDQRGAVHRVQTGFVEWTQTRVYAEVGKIYESVQD